MSLIYIATIFALCTLLVLGTSFFTIKHLRQIEPPEENNFAGVEAFSLLAALATLVAIAMLGDTFGLPGSSAYERYELINRIIAILLGIQLYPFITLYFGQQEMLNRGDLNLLTIIMVAWTAMAMGSTAEFWLFSDLPYDEPNMRTFAFTLFSVGSLIAGLIFFMLGVRLISRDKWFLGLAMLPFLPLDIALYLGGGSLYLAPALTALVIAGWLLSRRQRIG